MSGVASHDAGLVIELERADLRIAVLQRRQSIGQVEVLLSPVIEAGQILILIEIGYAAGPDVALEIGEIHGRGSVVDQEGDAVELVELVIKILLGIGRARSVDTAEVDDVVAVAVEIGLASVIPVVAPAARLDDESVLAVAGDSFAVRVNELETDTVHLAERQRGANRGPGAVGQRRAVSLDVGNDGLVILLVVGRVAQQLDLAGLLGQFESAGNGVIDSAVRITDVAGERVELGLSGLGETGQVVILVRY